MHRTQEVGSVVDTAAFWEICHMGAHLVHLVHWLHSETEHGGPLAIVGIVIGAVIGNAMNPIMKPATVCAEAASGLPCPDVFSPEALVSVLFVAVVGGAVGAAIGWLVANRN